MKLRRTRYSEIYRKLRFEYYLSKNWMHISYTYAFQLFNLTDNCFGIDIGIMAILTSSECKRQSNRSGNNE